jgi:hypothetical protein
MPVWSALPTFDDSPLYLGDFSSSSPAVAWTIPGVLTVFSDGSSRAPCIVLNGTRISSLIHLSLGGEAALRLSIPEAPRLRTAFGKSRLAADLSL